MKNLLLVAALLAQGAAFAQSAIPAPPDKPDSQARYLFYMHGSTFDSGDTRNIAQYERRTKALAEQGFVVISELRPKGVIQKFPEDHEKYAAKIAGQVATLLSAGVPAANITVSGYSRGGSLALMASGLIARADVNFVVLAGCINETGAYQKLQPWAASYAAKLMGRFLSIYDAADADFGSCASQFEKAKDVRGYREVVLKTGKGHFAFAEPEADWVAEIASWSGPAAKK